MKPPRRASTTQPTALDVAPAAGDRRSSDDRRKRLWWSIVYGNIKPRRRSGKRRETDARFHSPDWHPPHLLAVSMGIVLLSVADAVLTLALLSGGAVEVNPIMGAVVNQNAAVFMAVKMSMTSVGVMLMVVHARYRFMRVVRVEAVMYMVLIVYAALLSYEFDMLRAVPLFP